MNYRVYRNPAVKTILTLTGLDKSTRSTDDADRWKSYFIGITKHTFNPVVNLKAGTAYRASGFTLPGFNTSVRTEWAGNVFVALRHIFLGDLIHPCLSLVDAPLIILK